MFALSVEMCLKRKYDKNELIFSDSLIQYIYYYCLCVKFIADDLNVNTASRILMYENSCDDVGIPTGFLTKYEQEVGQ